MHAHALRLGSFAIFATAVGCFGGDGKKTPEVAAPDAGGGAGAAGASASGAGGTGTSGTGAGAGGTGTSGTGAGTGGGTMAPPPGQDGAAVALLAPRFAESYCGVLTRCVSGTVLDAFILGGLDCETQALAALEDGEFLDVQSAVDAGRVIYDPTKAEECFDMLDAQPCDAQAGGALDRGVCAEILTGTVAEGGDCGLDDECIGATFCDRTAGCPGTCVPQLAADATCTDDAQCASPLSCDGETQKCAMVGVADSTCGGGVAPDCGLGLMCAGDDADTSTAGACKAIDEVFAAELDATCDFDAGQLCMDGLSCLVTITGSGPGAMVVLQCAEGVSSGAPCGFAIPPQCPSGEYCADVDIMSGDAEGTCTPLPGDGDPCVSQFGPTCAAGLVCDLDGRCHPLGRLDDPCVSSRGCASSRCVSGTCERPAHCEVR